MGTRDGRLRQSSHRYGVNGARSGHAAGLRNPALTQNASSGAHDRRVLRVAFVVVVATVRPKRPFSANRYGRTNGLIE